MTQEEFKSTWIRESGLQPGIMLEVTVLNQALWDIKAA